MFSLTLALIVFYHGELPGVYASVLDHDIDPFQGLCFFSELFDAYIRRNASVSSRSARELPIVGSLS